jgi:hypothetical protein
MILVIVDIGNRLVDKAGSTYVVNKIFHDGFTHHSSFAGWKVNVTCILGPNLDKTMDVSYDLILRMREAKELEIIENENE